MDFLIDLFLQFFSIFKNLIDSFIKSPLPTPRSIIAVRGFEKFF